MASPEQNRAAWAALADNPDPDAMPVPPGVTEMNPRDPEAIPLIEQHLIAACIQGDDGAGDALDLVTDNDFTIARHRFTFGAIRRLVEAGRQVWAADVFEEVMRAGLLSTLGGTTEYHHWLTETTNLEATGMHARFHAASVRESSLFRQLRGVAAEVMGMASSPPGPFMEVVGRCEQLLFDLSDTLTVGGPTIRSAPEFLKDAIERIDARIASGGKLAGLGSGYPDLDDLLGGFRPGHLIVVGARPGAGKTALALNIAANVARRGLPVGFFSMEMPEPEISERFLSLGSGVSMHSIAKASRITDDEAAAINRAASAGSLGGCGIYLDSTPDQPAPRIASTLRRMVRRHGVQVAFVDYLQLVRTENPRENRNVQVGTACRRIRQMARECNIPVVLLCQLNREVENRGAGARPRLADLRDSGEIEQHANVVVLMHTPQQPDENAVWKTDLIVAKNRNGPVGDLTLMFRRAVMRFENYAPDCGEIE